MVSTASTDVVATNTGEVGTPEAAVVAEAVAAAEAVDTMAVAAKAVANTK